MKHGIEIQGRISGKFYVEKDVQKRLFIRDVLDDGMGGWVVLQQGDGTMEGDTVQRGLFWTKADAMLFLKAIQETDGGKVEQTDGGEGGE